jgi:hypothetical protein
MAEYPNELCPAYCGKGIGVTLLPNQLGPALGLLTKFKIRSYVEVGCGSGGGFMFTTELLRKTNALQGATCVDGAAPSTQPPSESAPYAGMLYEFLKQHSDYVGFYVGRAVQYASSHPQGPAPASTSGPSGVWVLLTSPCFTLVAAWAGLGLP